MKYILNKNYRLRGWTDHLACLESLPGRHISDLTVREYGLLSRCDGQTEITDAKYNEAIEKFLKRGVIAETEGAELEPGQAYVFHENRRIRNIDICITGCCDFRCRHCFNAADNASSRGTQPDTDKLLDLIARLDDCGVAAITFSGGEPLLHKGFLTLTEELAKRNIRFKRLVTNLYHMTPEIADRLLEQDQHPLISTSFDGLGKHEWLRQMPGSEKKALDGIAMMKKKGFRIRTTYCVWKDSMSAVKDSILRLEALGVDELRILNIEPSMRWRENAGNQDIPLREWLDFVCELLDWWYEKKINIYLDIWSYWHGHPDSKYIKIVPDGHCNHDREDKIAACADAYQTPYIDSDGRLLLCNAVSGFTKALGLNWGNVFSDDIHTLLREGPFIDQCSMTIGQMKKSNPECMNCEWNSHCSFGCRAEALAYNGEINSPDRRMCVFFKEGYYKRFNEIAEKHGLIAFQ